MNKCSNINTLGKRLRESLKEKEWSQDKLAKLIGQSKGTISNWCLDKPVAYMFTSSPCRAPALSIA